MNSSTNGDLSSGKISPGSSSASSAGDSGTSQSAPQWDAIAADAGFKELVASKVRFILPATVFFIVYYFALPILVGWFPDLMKKEIIGKVNIAYLFALSQFFMAWIVAGFYVSKAAGWDKAAAALLARLKH